MKKKLVSFLLALAAAASVCAAASAQGNTADTGLMEQISAQQEAQAAQDLPAMIQILEAAQQPFVTEHIWYDEAGNEITDPILLKELQKFEEHQEVCEHIWYDEAGNKIEDLQLIAALWSGMAKGVVAQPCCGNPSPAVYRYEQHLYRPGEAPLCILKYAEMTFCQNCHAMLSGATAAEGTHIHR